MDTNTLLPAEETQKPKFYNRRLLINLRFQVIFIIFLFFMCALVVLIDSFFYQLFVRRTMELTVNSGIDPAYISSLLVPEHGMLIRFIVISILVMVSVCGFCGLFLSHRIAGPIYRTMKVLEQVTRGQKVNGPVKLRTMDCFPELETALNDLVRKIQDGR